MYRLLLTAFYDPWNNNFWNFWFGQIGHTIFWGFEGKRDWWRGACLEWHFCLFLFIMVEFEKVLYSPDLKMVLTFLVTEVFQKGTMFK